MARQPRRPMASPNAIEMAAKMPCTTLNPADWSCPEMITIRVIQT